MPRNLEFFRKARYFNIYDGLFGESQCTVNLVIFVIAGGSSPANIRPRPTVDFPYLFVLAGVAVGAASSLAVSNHRPTQPPSLPAVTLIYGRDGFIQEVIDKIFQKSEVKEHISLRGGPGMGKTTTATGIIHHPRIARHFRGARHWVSCREASDIADDLKPQKLLEYVSESLNLDLSGSEDRRKDIKYFLRHHNVPRIIVLDNFETMWEPPSAQAACEDVLAFLASFPQLTILLTTRNAHDPATHRGVLWHQIHSIQPLSLDASRMLFTSLCPSKAIDSHLDDLLLAVDRIPLPIVLMASYGQENVTTSKILEIWNRRLSKRIESQRHRHDGDPMNKLDLSIEMSLEGPLIKSSPEAPVLLRIMAGLPGAIRHENLPGMVPLIDDVVRVAAVLVRTSLIMNLPDGWQMHSTIRSYMLGYYPLDDSHQKNVQAWYFQLIHEAGHDPGTQHFLERARRLSHEEINAQTILLDALEHNLTITSVSVSTDYSNYLFWNTPSVDTAKRTVELIRNQSMPTTDSLLPLALLRLGMLYYRVDNYPKAIEALEEAIDRYKALDQLNGVAQAQLQLGGIYRLQMEHTRSVEMFSLAYERFQDVEDTRGMSICLRGIGIVYFQDDHYSDAVDMILKAKKACSLDDNSCIVDSELELARVYRARNATESIRLSSKARGYYLTHGPQRQASMALYQKSIALYSRGDYGEAEPGLKEAYEEFRLLGNDAQMGYSVHHLAEMNLRRGSLREALRLYNRSGAMFEHMGQYTGNPGIGNKFMVAISLERQAKIYARLCQPNEAKWGNIGARALLENVEGKEKIVMYRKWDIQSRPDVWRLVAL